MVANTEAFELLRTIDSKAIKAWEGLSIGKNTKKASNEWSFLRAIGPYLWIHKELAEEGVFGPKLSLEQVYSRVDFGKVISRSTYMKGDQSQRKPWVFHLSHKDMPAQIWSLLYALNVSKGNTVIVETAFKGLKKSIIKGFRFLNDRAKVCLSPLPPPSSSLTQTLTH
jgi:hypothetical protein